MSDNEEAFKDSDVEDDEFLQDWTNASRLIGNGNKHSIPLRGEKDYEPDGTTVQVSMLSQAKNAMFNVLRQPDRGTIIKNQVKAFYDMENHYAVVKRPKGTFTNSIGTPNSDGSLTLQFYEFVYLVERGTVTPIFNIEIEGKKCEYILSIQEVYSFFKSQAELDEFYLYAYLKRMGYIVCAKNWKYGHRDSFQELYFNKYLKSSSRPSYINNFFHLFSKFSYTVIRNTPNVLKKILGFCPMKFTSTSQIYESIGNAIPFYVPPKTSHELYESKCSNMSNYGTSKYKIVFDIWKPNPNFKKSYRYLPDFQVVMYNKNSNTSQFPTLSDFREILQHLDYKYPFIDDIDVLESKQPINNKKENKVKQETQMQNQKIKKPKKSTGNAYSRKMKKIKDGYRSFLLAIMDDGLLSIVKITETDFGSENIWYVPPTGNDRNNKPKQKRKT